jgi:stalled ribosome rescue protein Dom34
MTPKNKLGIWMDHAGAYIIEFSTIPVEIKAIKSKFTHEAKEHTLNKSEEEMHNKEQHQQSEYYKELGEVIRNYDDVVIFGPTEAKAELYNRLKDDHLFSKIKIVLHAADEMNQHERLDFVKKYFSKE